MAGLAAAAGFLVLKSGRWWQWVVVDESVCSQRRWPPATPKEVYAMSEPAVDPRKRGVPGWVTNEREARAGREKIASQPDQPDRPAESVDSDQEEPTNT
jgi:hypothetical protein